MRVSSIPFFPARRLRIRIFRLITVDQGHPLLRPARVPAEGLVESLLNDFFAVFLQLPFEFAVTHASRLLGVRVSYNVLEALPGPLIESLYLLSLSLRGASLTRG
jgi:hypothetical protein